MAEQSRVAAQRAIEAQLHKANGRAPPAPHSVEWIGSQNIEISRTQPDDPSTPWDYIGHRFPREKSPGTAIHTQVFSEGVYAVSFKVLESKGNNGNGMYIGVIDGSSDLSQEKGGKAWLLDLNEGKLRTTEDGFNIGVKGAGVPGKKLMRGDMKCIAKGALVYLQIDMRQRTFGVEACGMGRTLTGKLTASNVALPPSVRLVVGLFQGHDAVQLQMVSRLADDTPLQPTPPPPPLARQPSLPAAARTASTASIASNASAASAASGTATPEPAAAQLQPARHSSLASPPSPALTLAALQTGAPPPPRGSSLAPAAPPQPQQQQPPRPPQQPEQPLGVTREGVYHTTATLLPAKREAPDAGASALHGRPPQATGGSAMDARKAARHDDGPAGPFTQQQQQQQPVEPPAYRSAGDAGGAGVGGGGGGGGSGGGGVGVGVGGALEEEVWGEEDAARNSVRMRCRRDELRELRRLADEGLIDHAQHDAEVGRVMATHRFT